MTSIAANLFDSGERKTLADLRAANLPRCTPAALDVAFKVNADVPESERAAAESAQRDAMDRLALYLRAFLPPGPCAMCGGKLGGGKDDMFGAWLGTFTWGLANGEGFCGRCRYPARGIHRIDLGDCGKLTLPWILQYHPEELREPEVAPP